MRERWELPEGAALANKVLRALSRGRGLDRLGLGRVDGRFDLRGLVADIPGHVRTNSEAGWDITDATKLWEFRQAKLSDLDLRGAKLPHLRFLRSQVRNCLFDEADLRGWRLWATEVLDSSFRRADLRDTALGTWWKGRGNSYSRVDFTSANLTRIWPHAAQFRECDFSAARLDKAELWGCQLIRCVFRGTLREVIFHRGFGLGYPEDIPLQPRLKDVDLAGAELRFCQIEVPVQGGALPSAATHLIVHRFHERLQVAEARLTRTPKPGAEVPLEWVRYKLKEYEPEELSLGILNRKDFEDVWEVGEAALLFESLKP